LKNRVLMMVVIFCMVSICLAASVLTVARTYLNNLIQGAYEKAYEMQSELMKQAFDIEKMRETWNMAIGMYGKFKRMEGYRIDQVKNYKVVIFDTVFERATLLISVTIDENQRVAGFYFKEGRFTYTPPDYVDRNAFEEKEVCFGTNYRICGFLTLPKGFKEYPAVVLVHGSGPHDRDETIGPNKVFRDIAWGLSSRGVAVLRYDKRTYAYKEKMSISNITVREEVIKDAVNAIRFLKNLTGVKCAFVLGHSLGGMLAPRIALEGGAEGIIMMAASPRRLHEIMIDQINYLKSIGASNGLEKHIPLLEKLGRKELDPDIIVLGAPASYYYDLNTYNPVNTILELNVPVLILQGGKDYQVTEKDYNIWRKELKNRKNIEYGFYEDLNHLFITSDATPSPMDVSYKIGHVNIRVIKDIAEWIKEKCNSTEF